MIRVLTTKAEWLPITQKSFLTRWYWALFLVFYFVSAPFAIAGEESEEQKHKTISEWKGHSKEEELKHEVSYLAEKLLEMSGKDTLTVAQEPYMKPFLGVCSSVTPGGVQLTCITPGHSAEASGLRTGDIIAEVDGVSMISSKTATIKKTYYEMLGSMKTGQVMTFKIFRGSEEKTIKATIGKLSQPGYTLTIRRK